MSDITRGGGSAGMHRTCPGSRAGRVDGCDHGSAHQPDLAAALARAGVDPRLEDRALQDPIKTAIGERRGYLGGWWVDEAGWCVELLSPAREHFHGLTLELALAWCLVFLMTDELGVGTFAGWR